MKKELPLYQRKILQDPRELDELCEIIKAEKVTSYLEIGAKFGGSFWRIANVMPKGSRVVAIDLPHGTRVWEESVVSLQACADELTKRGYDVGILLGDSQSTATVKEAASLGPYDCIFIDADHRLPGVTSDWLNYAEMSKNMVVFHDIAWRRAPEWDDGYRIDVPQLWNRIKGDFRHREIKHCWTGKDNGIGVIWMR